MTSPVEHRPSRRASWFRRIAPLALAGSMALGATACSESAEDLSDSELREALVDALTEDGSPIDAGTADCIVDGLFDNADRDQINRMANAETANDFGDGDMDLLQDVMLDCL